MPRAMVTGVAGFIGSFLGERLLEEGYEVIGIDNLFRGKLENIEHLKANPRFSFYPVDIRDENIDGLFENVELVFHCAAINGTQHFYERPLDVLDVNVRGTVNILECASKHKVNKFIYASSSEVYGEPSYFPTNESHPIILPNVSNPRYSYAASKAIDEYYTHWYGHVHGFSYLVLRIFNVYGPRMDTSNYGQVIPEFIRKLLLEPEFTIIGDGNQTRSFCYVDDIVELIIRAARSVDNDTLNLGNPQEITILNLARRLHQIEAKEFKYRLLPSRAGDSQRRLPDVTKAKKLLGYEPRKDIEEGLRLTLNWYKKRWRLSES